MSSSASLRKKLRTVEMHDFTLEMGGKPDVLPNQHIRNTHTGSRRLPKLNPSMGAGTKLPLKSKLQPTHNVSPNQQHACILPDIHQGRSRGGKPDVLPNQHIRNTHTGSRRLPKLNPSMGAGTKLPRKAKLQPTHNVKPNQQHAGMLPDIHQGHSREQTPANSKGGQRGSCTLKFAQGRLPAVSTQNQPNKQEHERLCEGHPLPMNPIDALNYFGERLTAYEKVEILGYTKIWYLGLNAKKIHAHPKPIGNSGYDDKRGTYVKVLHDHIAYRYEVLGTVGKGAFGKAFKCLDHKTNEMVVVKVLSYKKSFDTKSITEVKILDALRKEDRFNVVCMKEYFRFRNHLCITFELLGPNLYKLLRKHSRGLSEAEVCHYARELLVCLQMLRQKKIIHCDLKPENILQSEQGNGSIKVIDFGCSCYEHERVYSFVGTLPYCAPEVLLGKDYNCSVDMWSLGCILAELFIGESLFDGDDCAEQLLHIMEVLGMPPSNVVETCRKERFFSDPNHMLDRNGRIRIPGSLSLGGILKTDNHLFLDFMERCLSWDPAKRLTPEEALQHEWIKQGCH